VADIIYLEQLIRDMRAGGNTSGPTLRYVEEVARSMNAGTDARRRVVEVPKPGKDSSNPDAGTLERRTIDVVGRPDLDRCPEGSLPAPTKDPLAKQSAIQHNVVDESVSDGKFTLNAAHPNNTKPIHTATASSHEEAHALVKNLADHAVRTKTHYNVTVQHPTGETSSYKIRHNLPGGLKEGEVPWDDVQQAIGKIRGNRGNPVNLRPVTDDKPNDQESQDKASKSARKQQNDAIGQPGNTMKEESLDELFDKPYGYQLHDHPGRTDLTHASFKTDVGNHYHVTVMNRPSKGHAEVNFEHGERAGYGEMSLPNQPIEPGSAHRVMNTVKHVMDEHGRKNPHVSHFGFEAFNDEPSRVKLYKHMANKMFGGSETTSDDVSTKFRVKNPHHAPAVDETAPAVPYDPVTRIATKSRNKKMHSLQSLAQKVVEDVVDEAYVQHGFVKRDFEHRKRDFAAQVHRSSGQQKHDTLTVLKKHKKRMARAQAHALRSAISRFKGKSGSKRGAGAKTKGEQRTGLGPEGQRAKDYGNAYVEKAIITPDVLAGEKQKREQTKQRRAEVLGVKARSGGKRASSVGYGGATKSGGRWQSDSVQKSAAPAGSQAERAAKFLSVSAMKRKENVRKMRTEKPE